MSFIISDNLDLLRIQHLKENLFIICCMFRVWWESQSCFSSKLAGEWKRFNNTFQHFHYPSLVDVVDHFSIEAAVGKLLCRQHKHSTLRSTRIDFSYRFSWFIYKKNRSQKVKEHIKKIWWNFLKISNHLWWTLSF